MCFRISILAPNLDSRFAHLIRIRRALDSSSVGCLNDYSTCAISCLSAESIEYGRAI